MDGFELKPINTSAATKRKCLLGVTIMLVEDSLCASEALRLMAVASGARLRRADCLQAAQRHLATFRPGVVMVDMGLPDGNGLDLISDIARNATPCPALIAVSGGDVEEWGKHAKDAGANALLCKPINGIAAFQDVVLSVLPDGEARREGHVPQPFIKPSASDDVIREDINNAKELLKVAMATRDKNSFSYASQFASSIAAMLNDSDLEASAAQLAASENDAADSERNAKSLLALLEKRHNWDNIGSKAHLQN